RRPSTRRAWCRSWRRTASPASWWARCSRATVSCGWPSRTAASARSTRRSRTRGGRRTRARCAKGGGDEAVGCSCCDFRAGARETFDAKLAEGDLKRYLRRGPNKTTRHLCDGVLAAGGGQSLIDIGGGIGALTYELLERDFERSTIVDASSAYQ